MMLRRCAAVLAGLTVLVLGAGRADAQTDWSPPSPQMPQMPAMGELGGGWRSSLGAWFRGVDAVSGVPMARVEAEGETTPGSDRARFVRFTGGSRPVAAWHDRNGDGRTDMVELFRAGAVVVRVIDPDYDGRANVVQLYDDSGALVREDRL